MKPLRHLAAVAVLSVLAVLAVLASTARGADVPMRTTGIDRVGDKVVVSVGIEDLFGPDDVHRLYSGFASRVLVRVALYRVGQRDPVGQAVRATEIVYDLWGERFRLKRSDMGSPPQFVEVATAARVVQEATALWRFPILDIVRLERGAQYRLSFRADLNPISQERLAEVRRWLARPPGQGRLSPADSFFGSFVSIFVNPRIEESERRVEFFSQTFVERWR